MSDSNVFVCRVETPDGDKDYVTLLPPGRLFEQGLAPEAIVGELSRSLSDGEPIVPENFARNRVFVDFLHAVIARRGPELPDLVAEAKRQGDGWVYLIDGRTRTPGGPVPPEDIIGAFAVEGGDLVIGSYRPNPSHRILSPDGFFQLTPDFHAMLVEELINLAEYETP